MPGKPWSEEELELLRRAVDEGLTVRQIQERYFPDRSLASIENKVRRMGLHTTPERAEWSEEEIEILRQYAFLPVSQLQQLLPNRTVAAIEHKLKRLGLRESVRVPESVVSDSLWEQVISYQEKCREFEYARHELHYNFEGIIGVAFLSDMHIGSAGTDYQTLWNHIQLIQRTPNLYCVMLGEYCDFNSARPLPTDASDWLPPSQQFQLALDVATRLREKTLALVCGTHENWVIKQVKLDPVEIIARSTGIPYLRHGGVLHLTVGGHTYRLCVRHSYRFESSFNLTHAVKRMLEFYEDFDIGVLGHKHKASIEQVEVKGRKRVFIRCGTYKLEDIYAERIGVKPDSEVLMPLVILTPGGKLYPFLDHTEGVDYLLYLQGNGE